jgi:hypothetical protein
MKSSGLDAYILYDVTCNYLFDAEFRRRGMVVSLKTDRTVAYIAILNNRIVTKVNSSITYEKILKELVDATATYGRFE